MQIKPKNKNYQFTKEESQEIVLDENKEESVEVIEDILTISTITSTLMAAKVTFHLLHFQTTSFAKHLALEDMYKGVTKISDPIIECLLGKTNSRLSLGTSVYCNPLISEDTSQDILDNLNTFSIFANNLFKWATDNNYQDICNLCADLIQLTNNTLYKITLA